MNQRIILIAVIITSALIGIMFQNVFALKDSGWYDARDYYKKINKMKMFDDYPYKQAKLTVKVIHVSDKKITRDFVVQYGKDTLFLDHKEFKKKDTAKVTFYIDEEEKDKVCMMSFADNYEKCKKFVSRDDKNTVTFYIN